jgi:hypothetical protein
MHRSRESCCLDQLLSIKEHASLGVPLMIHTDAVDGQADAFQVGCFLIALLIWCAVWCIKSVMTGRLLPDRGAALELRRCRWASLQTIAGLPVVL